MYYHTLYDTPHLRVGNSRSSNAEGYHTRQRVEVRRGEGIHGIRI